MKNSELIAKLQQFPPDAEVKQVTCFPFGVFIEPEFIVRDSKEEQLDESGESFIMLYSVAEAEEEERKCRVCGCSDYDCSQCIEKIGQPCHWVEEDLCSACSPKIWTPPNLIL